MLLKLWDAAIQLLVAGAIFIDKEVLQLAQTHVYASAWGVDLPAFSEKMTRRLEKALQDSSTEDNVVEKSTQQVSKILMEIGFDHDEVVPDSNIPGSMMDDGDQHFLKAALGSGELTTKRNGSTKAKRRLLQQLGWTIINLDFRDYMEACQKSKQKAWLQAKLKQAGVTLP